MGKIVFTATVSVDRREVHLRAELNGEATERILLDDEIKYASFDLITFAKNDMRDQLQGTGIYAMREK